MPRVISNNPVRNILEFANQQGLAKDWRRKFLDELQQQQWMAGVNAENRNFTEDQRQFDAKLSFQQNQNAADNKSRADELNAQYAQPTPFEQKDAAQQRMVNLQLEELERAKNSGLVSADQYTRAKIAILGGDSSPFPAQSDGLSQQRYDLSQQRFQFEKDRAGGLDARRAATDQIAGLRAQIEMKRKSGDTYSEQYKTLVNDFILANDELEKLNSAQTPTQQSTGITGPASGGPAGGARPIAPVTQGNMSMTTSATPIAPALPAAAAGGGQKTPYSLIKQTLKQAGRDPARARAMLMQQGFNPDDVDYAQ